MSIISPLSFSRHSFVGSALVSLLVGRNGSRTAYLDGTMICLDNEYKFRSYVLGYKRDGVSAAGLLRLTGWDAPRWCVYNAEVKGHGGRLIGYVSIMGPKVEDGGSMVRVAALLKDLQAEAFACDLTAEELADNYRFMLNGYMVVVKSPSWVAL